jgi:putative tryptophan/tyrosine transport system substrate-binding protein
MRSGRSQVGWVVSLGALVLSLLSTPLATEAQQAGKIWRIGLISVSYARIEDVFFQQLRELGYVEGHNLVVERRYSEGRAERFAEFAAELVRLNLDMIIVTTTPAVLAVQNATQTIPIVQPNSLDPVGAGLAASLARPGGNFTGTTQQAPDTAANRLQWLVEAIPHVATVAVVWNAANPGNAGSWREVQEAARVLGLHVQSREVRGPSDFERIFAAMVRERPDALLLIGDRLTLPHGEEMVHFATQQRLPSLFDRPDLVTAGGLMSYGADEEEQWRLAAVLADKILKGAKPADLPMEQPTKFKFVINLKTAQALGITIPPHLLVFADEVIR